MDKKFFKMKLNELSEDGQFIGYAAVFGNIDAYSDIIDKGAFKRTIKNNGQVMPMLFNHDPYREIALTSSMVEDDNGLLIAGKLYISEDKNLEIVDARETYIKMKNRQAAKKPIGMSIGYESKADYKDPKDANVRHLKEIKLWEISVVTFPANELATVAGVKSIDDYVDEDWLTRLVEWCKEISEIELKEGRVLSGSNRSLVKNAVDALLALLEAAEPKTDSDSDFLKSCTELAEKMNERSQVLDLGQLSRRILDLGGN